MVEKGKADWLDDEDQIKTEKEQTFFRLLGLLVWSCYLFLVNIAIRVERLDSLICVTGVYLIMSVLLCVAVEKSIFYANFRRYSGITLDVMLTTVLMYFAGSYGAPLFSVYMWVIVGNGFRYGGKHMAFSALLSVMAFMVLSISHNFWRTSEEFVFTGFILLLVVPSYLYLLLKRLTRQKELAKQASEEKSRFIANVSHELRTPLNAIVGFSNLIGNADRDERMSMAEYMQEAAASLVALVENVLDISKIEAGRVDLRSEVVDLRRLLHSIEGMFSLQTREKGIEYRTVIDGAVPDYVAGDVQRMRQVLVNLIGNAVKFTERGGVDVHLGLMDREHGAKMLRFEIKDTGPGIPGEMYDRVFERYTQVDDTVRRKHQGAGLGTAIAKSLVELMDGRIDVISSLGEGSCFWFEIPVLQPNPAQLRGHLDNILAEAKKNQTDRSFSVLVAEDCDINRRVYRKMFDWLGIEVDFAETGMQVFDLLGHGTYRLLIVDMQMPDMSGYDVVTRYNETTEPSDRLPIVVITGDATPDIEERCRKIGVSDFLAKPVELPKLRALADRFIFPPLPAGPRPPS